jgi:hypothetical protein
MQDLQDKMVISSNKNPAAKGQEGKCVSMWGREFKNLVGVHGFSVS